MVKQKGKGRQSSTQFRYDAEHPLATGHGLVLRSKPRIPVLAGSALPRHPGPPPVRKHSTEYRKWRRAADEFATIYLTLMVPWVDGRPPIPLTWSAFSKWYTATDEVRNSFIERCRRDVVKNIAAGFVIRKKERDVLNAFRGRAATEWGKTATTGEGQCEFEPDVEGEEQEGKFDEVQLLRDMHNLDAPRGEEHHTSVQERRENETFERLVQCYGVPKSPGEGVSEGGTVAPGLEGVGVEYAEMADKAAALHDTVIQNDADMDVVDAAVAGGTASDGQGSGPTDMGVEALLNPLLLLQPVSVEVPLSLRHNRQQSEVYLTVINHYNELVAHLHDPKKPAPVPLRLIIHGGPGSGKSFVARALKQALPVDAIMYAAPTGVAASLLPLAMTLHRLLGIPVPKKDTSVTKISSRMSAAVKAQVAARIPVSCCYLGIDEFSMLTEEMFSALNSRLRQALVGRPLAGDELERVPDFGGVSMILFGDQFQIPAVGKSLLSAYVKGEGAGLLLRTFKVYDLDGPNERLKGDPHHAFVLKCLRAIGADKVVTVDTIRSLQKLKPECLQADPSWEDAVVLVGTNTLRTRINQLKAVRWGMVKGLPVFRWRRSLPPQFRETLVKEQLDRIYDLHPELYSYFVVGAPAMILQNVMCLKHLANGVACVYYSFVMSPEEDEDRVRQRIEACKPGEIIDLEYEPSYVNVRLDFDGDGTMGSFVSAVRKDEWPTDQTLVDGMVVVPLKPSCGRFKPIKRSRIRQLSYASPVVDLAFALTYHKCQGCTLNKVILDLSKGNRLTLAILLVALSRVRRGCDIRVLQGFDDLQHLLCLKHSDDLVHWWRSLCPVSPRSKFLVFSPRALELSQKRLEIARSSSKRPRAKRARVGAYDGAPAFSSAAPAAVVGTARKRSRPSTGGTARAVASTLVPPPSPTPVPVTSRARIGPAPRPAKAPLTVVATPLKLSARTESPSARSTSSVNTRARRRRGVAPQPAGVSVTVPPPPPAPPSSLAVQFARGGGAAVRPVYGLRHRAPPPSFSGISNLGNTCFVNSVVFVLVNAPHWRNFFLSPRFKEWVSRVAATPQTGRRREPAPGCLLSKAFAHVLALMRTPPAGRGAVEELRREVTEGVGAFMAAAGVSEPRYARPLPEQFRREYGGRLWPQDSAILFLLHVTATIALELDGTQTQNAPHRQRWFEIKRAEYNEEKVVEIVSNFVKQNIRDAPISPMFKVCGGP